MAAGLDTRAFRLRWFEPTHLFELDQPAILRYKEQILHSAGATPACVRHTLATDLTAPWQDANPGRWPFPGSPTQMPDMPHNWFVIAQKVVPNR